MSSTVCFPGTFPFETRLFIVQFMYCTYPHQITALLDHICSSFSYHGAILQRQCKKKFKKKRRQIFTHELMLSLPHCMWDSSAPVSMCVFVRGRSPGKKEWDPSLPLCLLLWSHPYNCSKSFMVGLARHWKPVEAFCIFSCKWYKLQQPFQCGITGRFILTYKNSTGMLGSPHKGPIHLWGSGGGASAGYG